MNFEGLDTNVGMLSSHHKFDFRWTDLASFILLRLAEQNIFGLKDFLLHTLFLFLHIVECEYNKLVSTAFSHTHQFITYFNLERFFSYPTHKCLMIYVYAAQIKVDYSCWRNFTVSYRRPLYAKILKYKSRQEYVPFTRKIFCVMDIGPA